MQLIFLAGVVCLVVSRRSSWIIAKLDGSLARPFPPDSAGLPGWLLGLFFYLLIFASCAGYFACFWRIKRRFVVITVIAPVLAALVAIAYLLYDNFGAVQSILGPRTWIGTLPGWLSANVRNFPAAFDLAALGLLLCTLFLSRAALGIGTFPLSLSGTDSLDDETWKWGRLKLAIFLLMGPQFLLSRFLDLALYAVHGPGWSHGFYFDIAWSILTELLGITVFFALPMWFLGKTAWALGKGSLGLPKLRYLSFGILVPVIPSALAAATGFLIDRAGWAANRVAGSEVPSIRSYVALKNLVQPLLWLNFIPAFGEEIVFRGIVLPLLMLRYGLHRGVFLTGLIWAAMHFSSDSYAYSSVPQVFFAVLHRVLICTAMNYVFAWMTLRSQSIIPAGLAHGLSNIFVFAGVVQEWWGYFDFRLGIWAILAYVLWRYWPIAEDVPPVNEETKLLIPAIGPEPAV
jgi:membrane protease YdiL (CAAX protease family)